MLITHALHQDGLVCSSSVGFASPAYTFAQEDEAKYYIKATDVAFGNETSMLYVTESGTLTQKLASAAKAQADDNFAWNILYDAKTAYYILRNVGTGKLLSCSNQKFKVMARTSATAAERVQLLPSRSNFKKGGLNMPSYWITINKTAMKVASKTSVTGDTFDSADNNTQQHWLVMTPEQMTTFDQYCTSKAMPKLDAIMAAAQESMDTDCMPTSEGTSIEEAAEPMTSLLTAIKTEKDSYGVDDIEDAITNLRSTFIAYLGNVQPASPEQPVPASWLIENRCFDESSDGWTNGPASIKNGVAEFLETTFNTYQTLPQLPAGNYMLTANAFQRPGTYQNAYNDWAEGKGTVKAQLYATGGGSTVTQVVQNIWDGASEAKKTGQCVKMDDLYVPNNALAVNSWFTDGCYENYLPVNLTAASTLRIGIRSTKSDASWWTCYDNFGLLFFGPYDAATGIGHTEADSSPFTLHALPSEWYDLNGRKLNGKPTRKGIYLHNGKKAAIK